MELIQLVLFILVTYAMGQDESNILWDKVIDNSLKPNDLNFESFTEGVYTVPGYIGRESHDDSEPPFVPSPECGESYLNLTEGSFGIVKSPNYPQNYPPQLQCEWTFESIPGTVIELTIYDLVTQPWLFTFSDYVMISKTGSWDEYRRLAGDANEKIELPYNFVSEENKLGIRLVTSRWLHFRGFKMSYVVRGMRPTDEFPAHNEYGSVINNDLVAVCSSKPISTFAERLNSRFHQNFKNYQEDSKQLPRIVNGEVTEAHKYPFMVAVLTDGTFFCGGSLIDEFHVITAAHCVDKAQQIDLYFGVYNLTNRAENLYARQFRAIYFPDTSSKVFIHPNYNLKSGANDIAVLRVNKLKINKYVQPIYLPSVYTSSNTFSGWQLRTIGFGASKGEGGNFTLSPVLREAFATVIPSLECRKDYEGTVTGNNICTRDPIPKPSSPEPETQATSAVPTQTTSNSGELDENSSSSSGDVESIVIVQAEDEFQYRTPCHGDSGAPLFAEFVENVNTEEDNMSDLNQAGASIHECVNAKPNGSGGSVSKVTRDTACHRPKDSVNKWYVQVGVLSFGTKVCGENSPVVYTRLTAYLQWLSYIIGRHG